MLFHYLIIFILLFTSPAQAQNKELPSPAPQITPNPEVPSINNDSALLREQTRFIGLINYAPVDLIIPSKLGVTLGYVSNAQKSWELEYMRGSVSVPFLVEDLGSMTDVRISLSERSFLNRNSFNIGYGISYFNYSLHLGDEILSRLSSGAIPSIDLVRIESLGLHFSIGNRWMLTSSMTLGVDWLVWSQPIFVTKQQNVFKDYVTNQQDKDDMETATKLISYLPRLTLLKLQFGVAF